MDFATASDKALQEKEAEVRLFFYKFQEFFLFYGVFIVCIIIAQQGC